MSPEDFDTLSGVLKERSGLVLTPEKLYLVESRLTPLARKRGMKSLDELIEAVIKPREEPLLRDVTEAMTTNESSFFRDVKPFELFRKTVLPALVEVRKDRQSLRIWCAACSTGQEPYSLAMCIREEVNLLAGWRIEIVATDLSKEVLKKAEAGLYSQFEVQRGLPIQMLLKYFDQVGELWQLKDQMRAMVKYREFNLLDDLSPLGAFDLIYCRNVLIYFDPETKAQVLDRIGRLLPMDGYLVLGGAETVLGVTGKFEPVSGQRGVYRLTQETSH